MNLDIFDDLDIYENLNILKNLIYIQGFWCVRNLTEVWIISFEKGGSWLKFLEIDRRQQSTGVDKGW